MTKSICDLLTFSVGKSIPWRVPSGAVSESPHILVHVYRIPVLSTRKSRKMARSRVLVSGKGETTVLKLKIIFPDSKPDSIFLSWVWLFPLK